MQLNVERVSRTGIFSNDKWYNISKFGNPAPSLVGIQSGMTVDVEISAKGWITKISGTGGGPPDATVKILGNQPVKSTGRQPFKQDPQTRREIARGTALKAVLGSPLLYAVYKNDSDRGKTAKEINTLINQFTGYILTGTFDEAAAPVNPVIEVDTSVMVDKKPEESESSVPVSEKKAVEPVTEKSPVAAFPAAGL